MKKADLRDELICAFKDTVSASGELIVARGRELRQEYEDCVQRYRKIVKVAGNNPGHEGSVVSDPINLGTENLPHIGKVIGSAVVRFCPFLSATSGQTARPARPFAVEVSFRGVDSARRIRHGAVELFGTPAYNVFGMRTPSFIRKPGTTLEEPFGTESLRYHHTGGSEFPWAEEDNYRRVAARLRPMIGQALDTQALLVEALQDDERNPQYAAAARAELTLPGNQSAAA